MRRTVFTVPHAGCLDITGRIYSVFPLRIWRVCRRLSGPRPTWSCNSPRREALTVPQVFKIGSYWVYFWSNENEPLEPVHVHVCQGAPSAGATKIWITQTGKCYLCGNSSKIPERTLRNIMKIIEARSEEIIEKWTAYFGEISYFCWFDLLPFKGE